MKKHEPKKGQFSIVMEYGEADVATALEEDALDDMRKIAWLKDSCLGVCEMHSKDLVWTDLKAENFALFRKGLKFEVKCIDLDCCVRDGQHLVGYTPKCMPPALAKCLRGLKSPQEKSHATRAFAAKQSFDMWGLGLYLWRMQGGREFHDQFYTYDDTNSRVFDEDACIEYLCAPGLQAKIDARIATIKNPKVQAALAVLLQAVPSARTTCAELLEHSLFHHSADATIGISSALKRIDGNLASVLCTVQEALATVLAIANDELKYPTTFIVLPVAPKTAGRKRSLADWLKAPDLWCNDTCVVAVAFESELPEDVSQRLSPSTPLRAASSSAGT
jgi:serine/threonine protein kinase